MAVPSAGCGPPSSLQPATAAVNSRIASQARTRGEAFTNNLITQNILSVRGQLANYASSTTKRRSNEARGSGAAHGVTSCTACVKKSARLSLFYDQLMLYTFDMAKQGDFSCDYKTK
jgi:hypothetical protein